MAWRIGVDSGGTFTDVCLFEEETGELRIWKVSSTPDDPSSGITRGVEEGIAEARATAADVSFIGHGTTVATNALIQARGVKTGLITTDGFRDLLEIGRQKRPDLYDLQADKPATLVSRDLRIGVKERLMTDGSIGVCLDEEEFREGVRRLKREGVQSIAVCFLYSFLDARHELTAGRILQEEFPEVFSALSHKVAPEFREYERLSTTVVNAYLGPVMKGYVQALGGKLGALGIKVTPQLTQSNGGIISFEAAAELPVRTVLSGPSTGVVAAQAIGCMAGMENLVTFDMGGTSSDVGLVTNGRFQAVNEAIVHGYPIKAPMLDIHTVGAGGGSIAYVDNGGLLKVGPRSAGASPGPACYGLGNDEPTVTDANVLLQTQNPESLLDGRISIDRQKAYDAVGKLAAQLGMGVLETANGILDIVTANMAKAIRVISVQRGHDLRDYTLVAFGGAGPVHAARLANELGMKRILIPLAPGVLCAFGLLMTDLRTDFSITQIVRLADASAEKLAEVFADLERRAVKWFAEEQIAPDKQRVTRTADMRYAGQNYEISIELAAGAITPATLSGLERDFLAAHDQLYGFVAKDEPVQIVTFRLVASGLVRKAELHKMPLKGPASSAAIVGSRDVWMVETGRFTPTKLYDRARLRAGNVVQGPAIINQMDTTTVVPPGMTARVDQYLNLLIEIR